MKKKIDFAMINELEMQYFFGNKFKIVQVGILERFLSKPTASEALQKTD